MPRHIHLILLLLLCVCPVGAQTPAETPVTKGAAPPKNAPPEIRAPRLFLKIEAHTQLMLGRVAYRNVGVNIPDLFERFLNGDDAGATRALADARAAGVHFARCWGTTWGPENFGVFDTDRARWFAAFDRMLEAADNADIAVVPSLLFNVRMLSEYVGRSGGKPDTLAQYLTPGTRSNNLALAYVTAMATRYRDDVRVLFWEIGNEYNLEADLSTQVNGRATGDVVTSDQVRAFLIQIAVRLHAVDKRHYVTSGNADMRPASYHLRAAMLAGRRNGRPLDFAPDWTQDTFAQYQEILGVLNPTPCDIISVHQYPTPPDTKLENNGVSWLVEDGLHALRLPWTQYACDSLRKPLFVGEFGQPVFLDGKEQNVPWLLDFLTRAQVSDVPLTALWSWEFAPTDPTQSPTSLSPQRTPRVTVALSAANAALLNAAVSGVTLTKSPPLDVNKATQQDDKMKAQAEQLRPIAEAVLKAAQARITNIPVRLPDGSGTTKAFSIRDAALMLGSDLLGADEIAGWVRLICAAQAGPEGIKLANNLSVPPYSIPDHLMLGGAPVWFPGTDGGYEEGNGEFGYLPPADNPYWFIQMVREHLRLTGDPTLVQSQVKTSYGTATVAEVCTRAFDSIPADANGLVVIGNDPSVWRVDWGFADTVHKLGACLMPSLLRWRAAKDLVLLFSALGDKAQITRFDDEVRKIRAAIGKTFYHALGKENNKDVGALYSATVKGRKDDLWASAYAVWSGALRTTQADAVAQHLRLVYQAGGSVEEGQVRPLPLSGPLGGTWEQTSTPPDTYQNGAFWGFPTGWYIAALFRVDRSAAAQMLNEFVTALQAHRKDGAPWQCVNSATKYTRGPQYAATVTAPYVALRTLLDPR
jgi:hypothetical protein